MDEITELQGEGPWVLLRVCEGEVEDWELRTEQGIYILRSYDGMRVVVPEERAAEIELFNGPNHETCAMWMYRNHRLPSTYPPSLRRSPDCLGSDVPIPNSRFGVYDQNFYEQRRAAGWCLIHPSSKWSNFYLCPPCAALNAGVDLDENPDAESRMRESEYFKTWRWTAVVISDKSAEQKNKPLDLSHLTPEEIARQVLETPPSPAPVVSKTEKTPQPPEGD